MPDQPYVLDPQKLLWEMEERYPLEKMVAGLGFGGAAPAVGAAGNVLGRVVRTARSLWPVRQAAKAASELPAMASAPASASVEALGPMLTDAFGELRGIVNRTGPNLQAIKGRQATWNALDRLGLKKWLLDVPAAPRGTEPLAIRAPGASVGDLERSLKPTDKWLWRVAETGERPEPAGMFTPRTNIATYAKASQENTLPHELTHWARREVPDPNFVLDSRLTRLTETNPKMADYLRSFPPYNQYPDNRLGEEILARAVGGGFKTSNVPELQSVLDRAWGAVQPAHFQDAPRIPLEIPYAVGAALWNK